MNIPEECLKCKYFKKHYLFESFAKLYSVSCEFDDRNITCYESIEDEENFSKKLKKDCIFEKFYVKTLKK